MGSHGLTQDQLNTISRGTHHDSGWYRTHHENPQYYAWERILRMKEGTPVEDINRYLESLVQQELEWWRPQLTKEYAEGLTTDVMSLGYCIWRLRVGQREERPDGEATP